MYYYIGNILKEIGGGEGRKGNEAVMAELRIGALVKWEQIRYNEGYES